MPAPHVFRAENGVLFTADPREILGQLATWLEQRHGGVSPGSSIVSSVPVGDLIVTLEVARRSTSDALPDTEPEGR